MPTSSATNARSEPLKRPIGKFTREGAAVPPSHDENNRRRRHNRRKLAPHLFHALLVKTEVAAQTKLIVSAVSGTISSLGPRGHQSAVTDHRSAASWRPFRPRR